MQRKGKNNVSYPVNIFCFHSQSLLLFSFQPCLWHLLWACFSLPICVFPYTAQVMAWFNPVWPDCYNHVYRPSLSSHFKAFIIAFSPAVTTRLPKKSQSAWKNATCHHTPSDLYHVICGIRRSEVELFLNSTASTSMFFWYKHVSKCLTGLTTSHKNCRFYRQSA